MRFSRSIIAFVVSGIASAQLPDIPSCSANCFISALTRDGCSSLTDFACHCQKPQLVSDITPCVQDACNVNDQSSVSSVVVSQCSSAGHPISVPPVDASPTSLSGASEEASTSATSVPTTAGDPQSSSNVIPSSSSRSIPSSSSSASASPSHPIFTGAASNVKSNLAGAAAVAAVAAYAM